MITRIDLKRRQSNYFQAYKNVNDDDYCHFGRYVDYACLILCPNRRIGICLIAICSNRGILARHSTKHFCRTRLCVVISRHISSFFVGRKV